MRGTFGLANIPCNTLKYTIFPMGSTRKASLSFAALLQYLAVVCLMARLQCLLLYHPSIKHLVLLFLLHLFK